MDSLCNHDQQQWEEHKSTIRYLYLIMGLSHTELVADLKTHGLHATENQVERQLKKWKFRRNIDKNSWKYINHRLTKRRQAGINTDICLSGVLLRPAKVQKGTARHGFVSTRDRFNPAPSPKTPENLPLSISTPVPLPMQFLWPQNLPWLQSQPNLSKFAKAIASTISKQPTSPESDLVTRAMVTASGSKTLMSSLQSLKSLSRAAAVIGKTMPESFDGENFTRAEILLNGEKHEAALEAIKVVLFQLSNNLTELGEKAILDLFGNVEILSRLRAEGFVPITEPSIAAITDKLFRIALSEGDKALDIVRVLLHLGVDINRATRINDGFQMPLQAAVGMGALKLTKLLTHAGADINTTFGNQSPPLIQSAWHGEHQLALQMSEFLISTNKLMNKSSQLNSALLIASSKCNIELVRFLVRQGASADHCTQAEPDGLLSENTVLVQALCRPFRRKGFWDFGASWESLDMQVKRLELAKYLLDPCRVDTSLPLTTRAARLTPDALIAATLYGNGTLVAFLHSNVYGSDINVCNARGVSPLRASVMSGDCTTFELLLSLGAKVDEPVSPNLWNRPSLLHIATTLGYRTILARLFSVGAKLDGPRSPNWGKRPTPLHIAAKAGDQWSAAILINHGADVNHAINLANDSDWDISSKYYYRVLGDSELRHAKTALQVAIYSNHFQCATHLLKSRARASSGDLISVVKSKNLVLVKAVLIAGGNVNERDAEGRSVLQLALQAGCMNIVELILAKEPNFVKGEVALAIGINNTLLAQEFLKRNARWLDRTPDGETILEVAIRQGDKMLFDFVLQNQPGAYDPGALCATIWSSDSEEGHDLAVLETLLQNRGKVKGPNLLEGTAIGSAAYLSNSRCLDLLLAHIPITQYCIIPYPSKEEALADKLCDGYYNKDGRPFWHDDQNIKVSPVFAAVKGEREDIINKLLDAGFVPDTLALLAAIESERVPMKIVRTLVQHDICIQGTDPGILTPLQAAVRKEDTELVRSLLSRGANVNAQPGELWNDSDYWPPRTALQMAVENGNLEIIKILLDSGAQINAEPGLYYGATALQLAAIQGFLGIAKMLLDLGADLDAPRCEIHGRTALEGAAEWGRLDMVQLFLNHGVQVEGKGRRQYIRAVKFARNGGHHAVERLLMEHRQWSEGELKMLEEEELYDEDFFDPEEWSHDEMEVGETEEDEIDDETDQDEMDEDEIDESEVDGNEIEDCRQVDAEVGGIEADDRDMSCSKAGGPMISEDSGCQNCEGSAAEYGNADGEDEGDWPEDWNNLVDLGSDTENSSIASVS